MKHIWCLRLTQAQNHHYFAELDSFKLKLTKYVSNWTHLDSNSPKYYSFRCRLTGLSESEWIWLSQLISEFSDLYFQQKFNHEENQKKIHTQNTTLEANTQKNIPQRHTSIIAQRDPANLKPLSKQSQSSHTIGSLDTSEHGYMHTDTHNWSLLTQAWRHGKTLKKNAIPCQKNIKTPKPTSAYAILT